MTARASSPTGRASPGARAPVTEVATESPTTENRATTAVRTRSLRPRLLQSPPPLRGQDEPRQERQRQIEGEGHRARAPTAAPQQQEEPHPQGQSGGRAHGGDPAEEGHRRQRQHRGRGVGEVAHHETGDARDGVRGPVGGPGLPGPGPLHRQQRGHQLGSGEQDTGKEGSHAGPHPLAGRSGPTLASEEGEGQPASEEKRPRPHRLG